MTPDPEEIEDGDPPVDITAAAKFRQLLRKQAQDTFDPLHQSMLDIDRLAEDAGLNLDYDPDFDDINNDW